MLFSLFQQQLTKRLTFMVETEAVSLESLLVQDLNWNRIEIYVYLKYKK